MSNKKIEIRSKDNKRLAGSISLGGKAAPKGKTKSTKVEFLNSLSTSRKEYQLATAEFENKFKADLEEADRIFAENLRKHGAGSELFESFEQAFSASYSKADAEYRKNVAPFRAKRDKAIAQAKANYPKKWWQSYRSWTGDLDLTGVHGYYASKQPKPPKFRWR